MRILVVEDEPAIAAGITDALAASGYQTRTAADGEEAWFLGDTEDFDLIVLDLGLPKMDGLTVLKRWRGAGRQMPVLILTARGAWPERVEGIDAGADDYLAKPFQVEELMARVRALLRRARSIAQPSAPIVYRHIEIDLARRRVRVNGRDVNLTANEFQLLAVLLASPGIVFSREALLSRVWTEETFVTVRSVDTLVKRVRRKIESDPAEPGVILTVWGSGYKAADVT